MTISLERAAANLRNHHEVDHQLREEESSCLNPPPLEPPSSKGVPLTCASRSRFRAAGSSTSSRTRSRTPSPPQSSPNSRHSSLRNSSKKARHVSPGGAAASAVTLGGVRFANHLVTAVYSRPRTPVDQRAKLFYSKSDEIRFREEAAYACDDEWLDQLEEDSLPDDESAYSPAYSISKAVVVFGSTTRTYGGGCALEAALESEKASSFSFDDDAFWSGQLTWS